MTGEGNGKVKIGQNGKKVENILLNHTPACSRACDKKKKTLGKED